MGCEGAMNIDLPIEVGPTEETVDALMDYLVGPLLPLKHTDMAKETPSESKQKSVAKQVHAAAVLYNYYHLNHHRESQFLKFDQFCNLAIMFKPSILHHMKYMCQSDRPILNNPENQLSLTEKAIMDACNISETLLNASANISNVIKEWPITKVAVLLIDSKKENCFLQFNNGVWSVIEKDLYPESKKRKKTMINYDEEGEVGFQKIAFTAVKEVAGIAYGEIKVLESHVVYSLSQAKTATRFYIVQSTQSISEDNLVPIQDAISSLQGPVVKKSLGSWVITPVVEYYYLLPYAEIISKFFSRVPNSLPNQVKESGESKKISDDLQNKSKLKTGSVYISNSGKEDPCDSKVTKNTYKSNQCGTTLEPVSKVADDVITFQFIGSPVDQKVKETENSISNTITVANSDSMKEKDMNGSCRAESNNSSSGANNNNISIDKPLIFLQKEIQNTKLQVPLKVYRHEKRTNSTNSIRSKANQKDLKKMSTISQSKDERVDGEKKSCMVPPNEDRSLTLNHNILEDFNSTVDAKRSELSDAALRALLNKRQKLYDQLRVIEGELTLCDKKIQAIMHGGIGDCLGLKLEAVIDCCNEICKHDDMQTQQHTNLHVSRSLPLLSGKSLSEAQLTLRKACQELDDICLSNNWMLPTYRMSRSDGGFVANVTVKGTNFDCSGVSGTQPSIHEARNSAATHVITRLQQMANEMNTALL